MPAMKTRRESVHGTLTLHRVLGADHTALCQELQRLSGSRDARKFPGSNPCSLERADFPKLKQQPYWLTEKTDGTRFLMVCTRWSDRNVCCLVDRTMAAWLLPLQALPTALYQGSVIDCELAFDQVEKQWQLLVFDVYVVSGIPVFHKPFSFRLAAYKRAMVVYQYVAGDAAPVKTKSFLPTSMCGAYVEHEASAARHFKIDGIILQPELSHAAIGRHTELFKVKTKHTVDFLVGATGTDLQVFNPQQRAHEIVARARQPLQPGAIAECVCAQDGKWDLVCVRRDKQQANDRLTFDKTLVNMREGITFDELARAFTS